MLGKYGNIYMNYLKEYKKEMYNNLMTKGKLQKHCLERENELKEMKYRIEKQLKEKYPQPKTNEFLVVAKYNQMIEDLTHEIILEEIKF
jgi:hypothetical protein